MKKVQKGIVLVLFLSLLLQAAAPVQAAAKINKTKVVLYVGQTVKLKMTGTNKKVTWSTSNKKVATVKAGKVTAKKKGTATITAKAGNKKYSCKVTVKNRAGSSELSRAVKLGLTTTVGSGTITFKQYFQILDKLVKQLAPDKLAGYKTRYAAAHRSNEAMTRFDGMAALLTAAETIGGSYMKMQDWDHWGVLKKKMGESVWDQINWREDLLGADTEITFDGFSWNRLATAYFFSFGKQSQLTGKDLFDYDTASNSMRPGSALTWDDAVKAALRLHDSTWDAIAASAEAYAVDESTSPVVDKILANADARRQSILNSPTRIVKAASYVPGVSYSGTAYYVSSSTGSDSNPGTADRPWKTVAKVSEMGTSGGLAEGDAVFFRRGDVWRGAYLVCAPGVTYSAYGTGAKPRFYGSAEDGADESKWKLAYSDTAGMKIWEFYKDMPDIGGVIFNEGESIAQRIYGWWVEGKGFMRYDDPTKPFDPEKCLTEDMTCASVIDYTGLSYPIHAFDNERLGKFYVRCDGGNPGRYAQVEFETTDVTGWNPVIDCWNAPNCTVDNLAVLYWGNCGISSDTRFEGIVVQNCEVGWGGNSIHEYNQADPTHYYMLSGDAIYGFGDGCMIRNNYCHEVDNNGITFETTAESQFTVFRNDLTIRGNLVERCGQGIWLQNGERVLRPKRLLIEDNMVLYTGEGYVHGGWCPYNGIWVSQIDLTQSVSLKGNTVYRAKDGALVLDGPVKAEGNTFVQTAGKTIYRAGNYDYIPDYLGEKLKKLDPAGKVLLVK